MISGGVISAGHARPLLAIDSDTRREAVADAIIKDGLNVRQTETLVNKELSPAKGARAGGAVDARGTVGDTQTGGTADDPRAGDPDGARDLSGDPQASDPDGAPDNAAGANDASGDITGGGKPEKGGAASGSRAIHGIIGGLADGAEREAVIKRIEDALRSRFSTRVTLDDAGSKAGVRPGVKDGEATGGKTGAKSGGKTGVKPSRILIEYYNDEDLQRLLEEFGLKEFGLEEFGDDDNIDGRFDDIDGEED